MYYTQSQFLLLFYIYCFIGWIWESCYVSFLRKEWINRGFLYGPAIPIYGTGAMIILSLTLPFRESILLIYILGVIGATVLEYFTGAMMERIFGIRYWDYSHHKFNIKGRISLFISLAWGIFSVLLVKVLHPPIEKILLMIPHFIIEPISLILTIIFVIDATKSIQSALDVKRLLEQLSKKIDKLKEIKDKQKELELKIASLKNKERKKVTDIIRRYPSSVSRRFKEIFDAIKSHKDKRQ